MNLFTLLREGFPLQLILRVFNFKSFANKGTHSVSMASDVGRINVNGFRIMDAKEVGDASLNLKPLTELPFPIWSYDRIGVPNSGAIDVVGIPQSQALSQIVSKASA